MFEVIKLSHVRIQAPPLTAAVSAKSRESRPVFGSRALEVEVLAFPTTGQWVKQDSHAVRCRLLQVTAASGWLPWRSRFERWDWESTS
jgi:hypothetical protein